MVLGDRSQLVDDTTREQGEVARVERQPHVGERGEEAVEEVVAGAESPVLLAVRAPCVDDVEPRQVDVDEPGDLLGRILQVAVHHDDDVPGGVVERGGQRRLVAEVPGEGQADDAGVGSGGGGDQLEGGVRAAVVDEDDLVGAAGEPVEHGRETPEELGKDFFLVEERDRHRDARLRRHCFRPPLK